MGLIRKLGSVFDDSEVIHDSMIQTPSKRVATATEISAMADDSTLLPICTRLKRKTVRICE